MSLSSYIKRHSRARPALQIIEEEPEPATKNSAKARRRHGLADLRIPRDSQLFEAVQGGDAWTLTLRDATSLDFPRPPTSSESDSSGPTTPTAETTQQCIIRCKSIKPLTITKRSRSVSPVLPPPVDDDEADDDVYYAAHLGAFITLAPPLPPSFPVASLASTSTSPPAIHPQRDSHVIPAPRPSAQLDPLFPPVTRRISIPTRQPPPPPTDAPVPNFSRPTSLRLTVPAPSSAHMLAVNSTGLSPVSAASSDTSFDRPLPRTPLPCDVLDDGAEDWVARAREPPLHPYPSLAALLSPPPPPASTYTPASKALPTIPTEADVPADAEEDDEWADVVLDDDEVPLSPLVASSPTSDEEEAKSDEQREWEALQAHPLSPSTPSPPSSPSSPSPPSPALARNRIDDTYTPRFPPTYPTYTGWHPRPAASPALYRYNAALLSAREAEERETEMRSAELEGEWAAELAEAQAQKEQEEQEKQEVTGQHRELKSKWSSSTLSSVASAHARSPQASAKGFGFRRLLSSPNNAKSTSTKSRPPSARPMGAVTPRRFAPPVKKTKKRLTAADVVVVGRPPATPSLLASASASLFSPPALASPSPSSSHSHSSSTSSSPGFPYAQQLAPTHGPRRRTSTTSAHSAWSYSPSESSSRSGSDGGCSAASGESGGSIGLRRKPIPVEMFLR